MQNKIIKLRVSFVYYKLRRNGIFIPITVLEKLFDIDSTMEENYTKAVEIQKRSKLLKSSSNLPEIKRKSLVSQLKKLLGRS